MADPEQVAILRQGVEAWNRWRRENLAISPDLGDANLSGADLTHAEIRSTIFGNLNLKETLGLDSCTHYGPSVLDYPLAQSGQVPLSFLRGCGLSDAFIEYLPSLLQEAIQFYSCFISYSTKDQEFADRLYADLQNKGVRCWFAPHDIQGGKKVHEQIDAAIQLHDRFLLLLSEASMNSQWVQTEIAKARKRELREKRRMLFPVRLVDFETVAAVGVLRCRYRQRFGAGDSGILCSGFQQVEGP